MGEVRTVLDQNEHTLKHLILGAYLERTHSWDLAFQSVTIKNLTHLDLVDTCISHIVLARIAHAHNLQSLTLHGKFEEPAAAAVVFGSDQVIDGQHTFLPHLEAFRFLLVGHDDEHGLYYAVTQFLRRRRSLRRLDLGSCPWEMASSILGDLEGLRVLGIRIANLTQAALDKLVQSIPREMVAINLSTIVNEKSLVSCFSSSWRSAQTTTDRTNTRAFSHLSTNSLSYTSNAQTNADQNRTSSRTRNSVCKLTCGTRTRGESPRPYRR